jgi:hypothetical protein
MQAAIMILYEPCIHYMCAPSSLIWRGSALCTGGAIRVIIVPDQTHETLILRDLLALRICETDERMDTTHIYGYTVAA